MGAGLEQIAEEFLDGGYSVGDLIPLAPFLSKAALNELVLTALERGEKINQGLLPFLSEDVLIEAIRRRAKQ